MGCHWWNSSSVVFALSCLLVVSFSSCQNVTSTNTTSSTNGTATPAGLQVNSSNVAPYFQVPTYPLYMCPNSDGVSAFGFNLPKATSENVQLTLLTASSLGSRLQSFCPSALSSGASDNTSATTDQTFAFAVSGSSTAASAGQLLSETPYVLMFQRKPALQQVKITLSITLDDDPSAVLYSREVFTLAAPPATTSGSAGTGRRLLVPQRNGVGANKAVGQLQQEQDEAETMQMVGDEEDGGELEVEGAQRVGGLRALLKGSGGHSSGGHSSGGKSGGSKGSKSSSRSKSSSSSSKSKSSKSSYAIVKVQSLRKGSVYQSKTSPMAGVIHWGTSRRSGYRLASSRGRSYRYTDKKLNRPLAYGMPLLFTSWFLLPPVAVAYGYMGQSLFREYDGYYYMTPAHWNRWRQSYPDQTCAIQYGSYNFPSSDSSDCWSDLTTTCCGQVYSNTKFMSAAAAQVVAADYVPRGTVLSCGLTNDLIMTLPINLPVNTQSMQVTVHSIEVTVAVNASTCGTLSQIIDPVNPSMFVTVVKADSVQSAACIPAASLLVLILTAAISVCLSVVLGA